MSTNLDIDRILARVKKMLTLANDKGASEGERDNAMRMAHATLAKYNLDLAQVTAQKDPKKKGEAEARTEDRTRFYGRPWARRACQGIAELCFCSYLYTTAKKPTDVQHYFIGAYANAKTAALLAEYVVTSILREGRRRQRAEGQDNAWWRAFCWGAAQVIVDRCREMAAEAMDQTAPEKKTFSLREGEKTEPGTAIVLRSIYETEAAANTQYIAKTYPRLGKGQSGRSYAYGSSAHEQGKAYGKTVNLNRQVGGGK